MKLKAKNNFREFTFVPGMEFKFMKGMKRGSFRILRIGVFPFAHGNDYETRVIIGGHFPYPYLSGSLSYGEFDMTVEEFRASVNHMDSLLLTRLPEKKEREKAANKGSIVAMSM